MFIFIVPSDLLALQLLLSSFQYFKSCQRSNFSSSYLKGTYILFLNEVILTLLFFFYRIINEIQKIYCCGKKNQKVFHCLSCENNLLAFLFENIIYIAYVLMLPSESSMGLLLWNIFSFNYISSSYLFFHTFHIFLFFPPPPPEYWI